MTHTPCPWALWRRQLLAIMRIDLKKTFFSKRGLWVYLLAFSPEIPMIGHWLFSHGHPNDSLGNDVQVYAGIFQFYFLRICVFFGCVGIFANLFRGEMMDKSLHYYLLAPVRREVLVAGKFLSGMVAAVAIFGGSVLVQFPAIFWHFPNELLNAYMIHGPGTQHLQAYFMTTILACLGYGSVFLAAGVLFRNPLGMAAALLVWESLNGILPALLKKISIIYWLQSLCPIPISAPKSSNGGILQLLVFDIDPAPPGVAIINLLLLAAFVITAAAMRARTVEIAYGTE